MKILIAADMEGISGVTHWDQVSPGHAEYERFRRVMTAEVNAAVQGAYEGGAQEVSVSDGHSNASNILVEELDRRARSEQRHTCPVCDGRRRAERGGRRSIHRLPRPRRHAERHPGSHLVEQMRPEPVAE